MKIPIEVDVVMESCRNCKNLEIKTIQLPKDNLFICKNLPICKGIIMAWEEAHPERGTTSK